MKPRISKPTKQIIGPSSPVQQALRWLKKFFGMRPIPDIAIEASSSCGNLIATHLLHLINGCGLLKGIGHNSAAASLFRPLEDVLDCFGATVMVPGAAEKWQSGRLKASDAAKAWTPKVHDVLTQNITLSEYRKSLHKMFNNCSHCSYDLCLWNLYFNPQEEEAGSARGTLELNLVPVVIDSNGHSIDAHLTPHILEFIILVKKGYSKTLTKNPIQENKIGQLQNAIIKIMKKHDRHGCQQVTPPAEIRSLRSNEQET